jgi:hypothetical protein
MADNMFDRCTEHGLKLSFTTQAQRGAHTTLERAQVMPYSLSNAATATGLTRR